MVKRVHSSIRYSVFSLLVLMATANVRADNDFEAVLTLEPPLPGSSVAIEIPTPSGQGLTGLKWFHNDAQVAFPKLVLVEGESGSPPDLSNAGLILLELTGQSLSWGEVDFGGPVTSSTGTAIAVFTYPDGLDTDHIGEGGGPGIGIREAETEIPFYLSGDGANWAQFDSAYELGVEPVYAQGKAGARVLSEMAGVVVSESGAKQPVRYKTELLDPHPNPFNPRVEISFSLSQPKHAEIIIYDVRGRTVKRLLSEQRPAGLHRVIWEGRDDSGNGVASGVYFARFNVGGKVESKRLALVR